ncbi:DUF3011 domain-containing protein [Arenimonas sp. MALMAid1274]|uniref:DUF3011 domain-containing protein n=1 Tax=Arenimonas sp. MALMAid1274 TaxID=3411630 RepID=UPI003BA22450
MNARLPMIAAVALGLGLLHAPSALADQTVRCESQDNQWRSCSVDTRGGVRLSRQLSSQGCWQGDTWGYDRNRIWVTRGCRAEFRVGSGGGSSSSGGGSDAGKIVAGAVVLGLLGAAIASHDKDRDRHDYRNDYRDDGYYDDDYHSGNWGAPDYTFECESRDDEYTRCTAGSIRGRGHVEIVRQLSKSQCRYGYSWGVERNQVWVDHGCRAEFGVYR